MRRNVVALLVLYNVVAFAIPALASAAGLPGQIVPTSCNGKGGCQSICDIATIAQNILTTGIYLAVFLCAVLFAWAGLKMLTSVANPGERSKAKGIFINVAVGLVIILAGWLIVDTLMRTLTGANFGPWNKIC